MSLFGEPESKELLRLAKKLEESSVMEISIRNQFDSIKRKINSSFENSKNNEQTILDLISMIETEISFQENYENKKKKRKKTQKQKISMKSFNLKRNSDYCTKKKNHLKRNEFYILTNLRIKHILTHF